jgi:hypothetical protein
VTAGRRAGDEVPVWAITCFYVRKGIAARGVMSGLIASVVDHARTAGAPAVEAYPSTRRSAELLGHR